VRADAADAAALPAVGDWVAAEPHAPEGPARVCAVLPRRGCFSRRAAGRSDVEQVIAANVDVALLVSGLDRDFSVRRIERYLLLTLESGARPVILLNKADLRDADGAEAARRAAVAVAGDAPVHLTSGHATGGLDPVRSLLGRGRTVVLLGSSGVGKSTIVNALLGETRQATGAVRAGDDKGRHTTTSRELLALPGGGVLIDTPGLREVQLWIDEATLAGGFADIEHTALECRFRDCCHRGEPGCAVARAVEDGRLDQARLDSYHKLGRELEQLEARTSERGRRESRRRDRELGRLYKRVQREKRRRRGRP
ncbi:MAG: ribosome small subunit-dependent GTPase A, partial [Planctomycetota bacterium]|jgi:ribosome biogenesis GTPase